MASESGKRDIESGKRDREREAGQVRYWQYGQAENSPDLAISDLSRFLGRFLMPLKPKSAQFRPTSSTGPQLHKGLPSASPESHCRGPSIPGRASATWPELAWCPRNLPTSSIRAYLPPARGRTAENPPFPDAHRQPSPSYVWCPRNQAEVVLEYQDRILTPDSASGSLTICPRIRET